MEFTTSPSQGHIDKLFILTPRDSYPNTHAFVRGGNWNTWRKLPHALREHAANSTQKGPQQGFDLATFLLKDDSSTN